MSYFANRLALCDTRMALSAQFYEWFGIEQCLGVAERHPCTAGLEHFKPRALSAMVGTKHRGWHKMPPFVRENKNTGAKLRQNKNTGTKLRLMQWHMA